MSTIDQYEDLKIKYDALKLETAHYKKLFKKSNAEFSNEIAENVATKLDLNNKNQALSKRIKELSCLINISKLYEKEDTSLDIFLKKVVETIVPAFRYQEYASVKIMYKDQLYQSDKFVKTQFELEQKLCHQKEIFGSICICYKEELAKINEDPYLKEEKQLLSAIASNLGQIIHRKETEGRLKMFQRAISQSPLMISITNLKTKKFEYVNSMYHEIFGVKRGNLTNHGLLSNLSENNLNAVLNEMVIFATQGKTWTGTYQNKKKSGEAFWERQSLYPLYENGEITHLLNISEDITYEIKVAEELRVNKENYEHITQNVPEAIFIATKNGHLLYANKKASEVTGYSNSEILNLNLRDLVHPDDYAKVKVRLVARLASKFLKPEYETRVVTKTGETRIVEATGSRSKWMGEMVDLAVITDITEKRRFENLLKIHNKIDYLSTIPIGLEESLKNIFYSLIEFNWIDGGGVYVMDNDQNELQLAFHKGLSTKFIKRYQILLQESEQYSAMMSEKFLYLNSTEPFPESKYLNEEGIKEVFIIPLLRNDRIIGALNLISRGREGLTENEKMIFESIGNRVAQMVALIMIQDQLTLKNKELQKTLIDKQEKQQLLIQKSKLESLGEMAAGVAHEINQPLGIILLSLENVLFKISAKKASRQYLDDKFTSIFNNISKIKTIIDHIRTFSHDQKSIIIERINVNEVIRNACSFINEQYGYHNISLNLSLDEDIGYSMGNNQKMEQVIFNLLSNAKFALEEKDALSMSDPFEKEINISTYSDDKKIYIDVKDNGIGIKKDNLHNIFNPFFTTKSVGVGTGLGLSIVYGIITEMKGAITIESKRNEFTLARLELLKYEIKT